MCQPPCTRSRHCWWRHISPESKWADMQFREYRCKLEKQWSQSRLRCKSGQESQMSSIGHHQSNRFELRSSSSLAWIRHRALKSPTNENHTMKGIQGSRHFSKTFSHRHKLLVSQDKEGKEMPTRIHIRVTKDHCWAQSKSKTITIMQMSTLAYSKKEKTIVSRNRLVLYQR